MMAYRRQSCRSREMEWSIVEFARGGADVHARRGGLRPAARRPHNAGGRVLAGRPRDALLASDGPDSSAHGGDVRTLDAALCLLLDSAVRAGTRTRRGPATSELERRAAVRAEPRPRDPGR